MMGIKTSLAAGAVQLLMLALPGGAAATPLSNVPALGPVTASAPLAPADSVLGTVGTAVSDPQPAPVDQPLRAVGTAVPAAQAAATPVVQAAAAPVAQAAAAAQVPAAPASIAVVSAAAPAAPAAPAAAPVAAATTSGANCAGASDVPTAATIAQSAAAVLCLINAQRSALGLRVVRTSRLLARTASGSSGDMVRLKYFAHVSPTGMTLRKRAARVGYRGVGCPATLGEVLAFGSGIDATPAALVSSLMGDPAHRKVMLDRRFRDVGVGLALGAPLDGMGMGSTLAVNFGKR